MTITSFNELTKSLLINLGRDLTMKEENKINRLYSLYILNSLDNETVKNELSKICKNILKNK